MFRRAGRVVPSPSVEPKARAAERRSRLTPTARSRHSTLDRLPHDGGARTAAGLPAPAIHYDSSKRHRRLQQIPGSRTSWGRRSFLPAGRWWCWDSNQAALDDAPRARAVDRLGLRPDRHRTAPVHLLILPVHPRFSQLIFGQGSGSKQSVEQPAQCHRFAAGAEVCSRRFSDPRLWRAARSAGGRTILNAGVPRGSLDRRRAAAVITGNLCLKPPTQRGTEFLFQRGRFAVGGWCQPCRTVGAGTWWSGWSDRRQVARSSASPRTSCTKPGRVRLFTVVSCASAAMVRGSRHP